MYTNVTITEKEVNGRLFRLLTAIAAEPALGLTTPIYEVYVAELEVYDDGDAESGPDPSASWGMFEHVGTGIGGTSLDEEIARFLTDEAHTEDDELSHGEARRHR